MFMKKEDQDITLLNSDVVSDNDQIKDNFKTTNVNILLNRVRLDKKRTFKKRISRSTLFTISYIFFKLCATRFSITISKS